MLAIYLCRHIFEAENNEQTDFFAVVVVVIMPFIAMTKRSEIERDISRQRGTALHSAQHIIHKTTTMMIITNVEYVKQIITF